jgi:glycosyltransferase involved in cell wall biosynthesis
MNKSAKKKIVFVLPDLTSGGAERVMSFVAQNISKDQFDVYLWLAGYSKNTKYNVNGIKVIYFNKSRVLKAIPSFYRSIRRVKPQIVISSISHLNTVMGFLSLFNPNTKFIGREANVLSVKKHFASGNRKFYGGLTLTKFSYKLLDLVLCQSKDMFNDMKNNFGVPEHKLRIINNPITDNFNLKPIKQDKQKTIQFITVARLKEQKGHERIIRALSKIDFPFQYTIVGDGPEKDELFRLIDSAGLSDKVIHIPYTHDVPKYLSESDLFLQGAFVEGFPNCLIESCAVGTPIVAFDAPGGLDEIIEIGFNGFIARTEEEYKNLIIKAAKNHSWKPEKIRESILKKFNKEKILKQYEDLFCEIIEK